MIEELKDVKKAEALFSGWQDSGQAIAFGCAGTFSAPGKSGSSRLLSGWSCCASRHQAGFPAGRKAYPAAALQGQWRSTTHAPC